MRTALIILPLAALAACATPREECIDVALRDTRVINALVTETQRNLQRGYAIEQKQEVRTVRETCRGRNEDGTTFRFRCDETRTITTNVPVAIDLNEEQKKLDSLLERQALSQSRSNQAIAQCIAVHPE
ncbi:hypothetical protein [Yoonia sp. SS1-5]|uniref:Lipoprotein n=1 Tax=Yoonia rhodophyticola TaxID=3137370 RepID=A0AAN0MCH4_9RHOB